MEGYVVDVVNGSSSNSSTDPEKFVTAVLQSSMTVSALIFHIVTVVIVIFQLRRDRNETNSKAIASQEIQVIWFIFGLLCIFLGVYIKSDAKIVSILQEVFHITTGLGVGVYFLISLSYSVLSRNTQQRQRPRGRRGRRYETLEGEPSQDGNEQNDLNRDGAANRLSRDDNFVEDLDVGRAEFVQLRSRLPFIDALLSSMIVCVVIVEMVFLFGLLSDEDRLHLNRQEDYMFHLHNATVGVYMVQILAQPLCYMVLIKNRRLYKKLKNTGLLLFRYMALFNLTMIINSATDCHWSLLQDYDNIKLGENAFGHAFNVVFTMYSSMILNTRTLFVYLFLQCAADVAQFDNAQLAQRANFDPQHPVDDAQDAEVPLGQQRQPELQADRGNMIRQQAAEDLKVCRKIGVFIGFGCVIMQALLAIKYIPALKFGPEMTTSTVAANLLVFIFSCLMIKRNLGNAPNIVSQNQGKDSLVHLLNILGAFSFLYISLKVILSSSLLYVSTSAKDSADFVWSVIKHTSELVTIPTLIVCVNIVHKLVPVTLTTWSILDYMILPALMFGVLGMGIGVCVDQSVGVIIEFIRKSLQTTSIQVLLEVGPSVYVAFLIDVFYKLFLIYLRIR